MNNISFGAFLGPEGITYAELKRRAQLLDDLGYHSIWLSDHLLGMYTEPSAPRFECWTVLTALGAATSHLKLGQLTLAVPFRNPALLAKMASTLDAVTDGRAILSIGAGWHRPEFDAYGYSYGTKASRSRQLREAAAVIKKMLTSEAPSYEGRHYRVAEAYNSPKGVQPGGVPLMIAGEGEKKTLRTCAMYGDMSNYAIWRGTPEKFRHKTEVLTGHCVDVGRNPDEILKTWPAFTFIADTDDEAKRTAKRYYEGRGVTELCGLIGGPESTVQRLHEYVDAGAELFMPSFLGPDWEREARLFMENVVPEFR